MRIGNDVMVTRNELAALIHRQPRWVTENLIAPALISSIKIGGRWYFWRSDVYRLLERITRKGRVA